MKGDVGPHTSLRQDAADESAGDPDSESCPGDWRTESTDPSGRGFFSGSSRVADRDIWSQPVKKVQGWEENILEEDLCGPQGRNFLSFQRRMSGGKLTPTAFCHFQSMARIQ